MLVAGTDGPGGEIILPPMHGPGDHLQCMCIPDMDGPG